MRPTVLADFHWDYSSVSVWGLNDPLPTGEERFIREVTRLVDRLGGDIEIANPRNGYSQGYRIHREDQDLLHVFTYGTGAAEGSTQFEAASTASEVYPIIKELFPYHGVSRLDSAIDFVGADAWDLLVNLVCSVASKYGVSMAPFGEGHVRPDGTRDPLKGRTWYFGSKSSVFRIVLYEKGKEQLAKGNIADPTWVRLEVRIRPKSTAKELIGEMNLQPSDLLRMSKWGKEVGESLGFLDLDRINIGSVWKPDDEQLLVTKIARLFNGGLGKAYEKMTPVVFGELLYAEFQKQVEISNRLKQLAA